MPAAIHDTEAAFDPQTGRPVEMATGVVRVTAANAGPYTHTGTNSYIVGIDTLLVVDPGPDEHQHLQALLAAVGGRRVDAIVLTHTRRDHAALALRLRAAAGARVMTGG